MADPEIVAVAPLRFVAVRRDATPETLLSALMGGFEEVWTFLRTANARTGRNVAVYRSGASLEVGVEVSGPVPPLPAGFELSYTPSSRAARFSYSGSYQHIPSIHQHLRAQLQEQGQPLEGTAWDVYEGWSQNPRELRAEIYYLLKS